jgi:hypothetical protein
MSTFIKIINVKSSLTCGPIVPTFHLVEVDGPETAKKVPAYLEKLLTDTKTEPGHPLWFESHLVVKQGGKMFLIHAKKEGESGFVKNEIKYHPLEKEFSSDEKFQKVAL